MSGGIADTDLRSRTLNQLRAAIQTNTVSFPSPTPVFAGRDAGPVQWRMAHLFFVAGWSLSELGRRYQVPPWRASLLVRDWADRVIALHLLEAIPDEPLWPGSTPPIAVELRHQHARISSHHIAALTRTEHSGTRSKKRYSERDIEATLREFHQGRSVQEICRKYGIASRTFYAWRRNDLQAKKVDGRQTPE